MTNHPTLAVAIAATLIALGDISPAVAQERNLEQEYATAIKERDAGKYETACPKLKLIVQERATKTFAPGKGLGARFELAVCYEKQGKLASAVEQYSRVETLAAEAGQKDRVTKAQARAAALWPRLALLTIQVPADVAAISGLVVRLDGNTVEQQSWGSPMPVDAGNHVLTVTAPDRTSHEEPAAVPQDGARVVLTIKMPALKATTGSTAGPLAAPGGPELGPLQGDGDAQRSWQRPVAIGAFGLGVVGLGVGVALGVDAMGKLDASKADCAAGSGGAPDICTQAGLDLRAAGRVSAGVSTVAFIAGGALATGGLILWLTAPAKAAQTSARVTPTAGGWVLGVHGMW